VYYEYLKKIEEAPAFPCGVGTNPPGLYSMPVILSSTKTRGPGWESKFKASLKHTHADRDGREEIGIDKFNTYVKYPAL
jgi:hypothetical protein